ncbi:fumarate hydratase [Syntrophobacter fumaroxidans]|uniref:Fumarate hydratase class I n=1 Tax=Syntrophobacter fumaroxidans (strain DSM 10017 / MPOB) TaxID=335543 RepID=A0LKR5_SYNFM|nr:fumarate hydratase [Syntrophobacter fumaroxidans]ABK18017.1 fumarase [Syntrophobacter fumaroxidans MPOB]
MAEFVYQDPFPLGKDETKYRLVTKDHVSVGNFDGKEILKIDPEALALLANTAMRDVSFMLRPAHLEKVAAILSDPESSANDRGVAVALLRNAEVAAKGVLPLCQDTGTATIVGKKGQQVWTGAKDEDYLSRGVFKTYTEENLRYSQTLPLTMYEEVNSGTNMPAQIDLYATDGMEYKFLFVAKGGGSANKNYLYQETKALLNPTSLEKFLVEKMKSLGTAACPPYHLAFVVGGTSAEGCLKTVKLASTGYLDALPTTGNKGGQAFRDLEMEDKLLKAAYKTGLGAQFGGKHFVLDVRVVRLPRHGASCPLAMGVSCSADRNIKAKINKDGIWVEQMEANPGRFIPEKYRGKHDHGVVKINLNRPMKEILADLSKYPVTTQLSLTGTIIVGRDIAHAKLKERIDKGEGLPQYVKDHAIYYAGPAKTPKGMASGSFGPTTAGRMDSYVDLFQSHGGSMIMIAKGNRSQAVTDACKKHGGFYLGSIGGPAALLAQENIKKVEVLEYPELGMEAIWKIEVEDFPAFILVDDKGNDFFQQLSC